MIDIIKVRLIYHNKDTVNGLTETEFVIGAGIEQEVIAFLDKQLGTGSVAHVSFHGPIKLSTLDDIESFLKEHAK